MRQLPQISQRATLLNYNSDNFLQMAVARPDLFQFYGGIWIYSTQGRQSDSFGSTFLIIDDTFWLREVYLILVLT